MLRRLAVTLLVGAALAGTVSEASAYWGGRGWGGGGWGWGHRSGWGWGGPWGALGGAGLGLGLGYGLGYASAHPAYGEYGYC
jgi:hypothetical protein